MKMDARLVPHDIARPIARAAPRRDLRGPVVMIAAALAAAALATAERPVVPPATLGVAA